MVSPSRLRAPIILFLIIATIAAVRFAPSVKPATHLALTPIPTVIDFGSIEAQSEPLNYRATLHNPSNKDILISKVETSCGCTTVDLKPGMTVPANKSIFFNVGYSLPEGYFGPLNASISIVGSIEGEFSDVRTHLNIKANSLLPAVIEPLCVSLSDCSFSHPHPVGSVTIFRGNSQKHLWDDIQVEAASMTIVSKTLENNQVTLQLSPNLDPSHLGSYSNSLLIYLLKDGKKIDYPPLVSKITGKVVDPNLSRTPSIIYLGSIVPSQSHAGVDPFTHLITLPY